MTSLSLLSKTNNAQIWPTFYLHASDSSQISRRQKISLSARPKRREIQIDTLITNDDLAALKKSDPFLYYSIPSVRDAEMKAGEVNVTCLEKSSDEEAPSPARRKYKLKSSRLPKQFAARPAYRLRFEYHADKLMAEYFKNAEIDDDISDGNDDFDDLVVKMMSSDNQTSKN
eukprot:CAMPEP_0171350372 /NCGR_PEP_ID=MMETSP0878-20121228/36260_1 /TAXON_ID=67004 /ORGANISM="Thalassiosira weissflogii, Strain CCMP1336" /LENGTH=171 /DNA_ID=CAMNT_0011855279 /DNA_START=18 /DNA_END=534 /DNA_ORIENTATION=-